mmetsp:Transcript_39366/g.37840  ORF Transcript_39366/g.37840 Transcript_39366/m.37840 type:complete len:119 (+) Transcript_39366:3054-3410(+)
MLASVILFNESFSNIVTITFSALIIIELLNVYSVVNKLNWKMILSSVFTFIIYFLSIALLRSYFDTTYITWQFVIKVVALTMMSWAPLESINFVIKRYFPSREQKIMKQELRAMENQP